MHSGDYFCANQERGAGLHASAPPVLCICVHACSDPLSPSECCRRVCICFMVHLTFSGAFAFCNLGITTNAAPIKKMIREQRTSSLHIG